VAAVLAVAPVGAQHVGQGPERGDWSGSAAAGYSYGPGGYGPGGYGPGAGSGRVELKFMGKRKQRSDRAVKVKATCGPRACMLDARGRLESAEGNGHLKPRRDVPIEANETRKLRLKLNRKGKRAASAAERSRVTVKGKAIGAGGGGKDRARRRIKLV
jgi:hypothetical protein